MNWLLKIANSDKARIESNIERLEALKSRVHDLGYFAVASQSGGYQALLDLLDNRLVKGRDKVYDKLKSALVGENNSKLVLDAPTRFQGIMVEAEELIDREIVKEKRKLRELLSEQDGNKRFKRE